MKYLWLIAMLLCVPHLQAQQLNKTHDQVFTELDSEKLGEKRRVIVHLPLNYQKEPTKHYPVMYVLDASKLDFDIANRLFALSTAGYVPETIVVGILNVKDGRDRDLTPPFMQTQTEEPLSPMGKGDKFLDFIKLELIPYIQTTYRTTKYKGITGHSRGGLLVLFSLIKHPEIFDAYFAYSTPAWRFDNILIHRLEESLKKKRTNGMKYLFFSVGEDENANIKGSFDLMQKVLRGIKPRDLKWDGYITPLADHQSNPVYSVSRGLSIWGRSNKK